MRIHQLHRWFPRVHWEARRGEVQEARDYCTKEGKWRERGSLSTDGKVRTQDGFERFWAEIIEEIKAKRRWSEVILDPVLAPLVSRCMQWAKQVFETRPVHFPPLNTRARGYRYQERSDLSCFWPSLWSLCRLALLRPGLALLVLVSIGSLKAWPGHFGPCVGGLRLASMDALRAWPGPFDPCVVWLS